jgi:cell division septation protein DedD
MTVSLGIARAADLPGEDTGRLLRAADAAMYRVKTGDAAFPCLATAPTPTPTPSTAAAPAAPEPTSPPPRPAHTTAQDTRLRRETGLSFSCPSR